MADKMEEFCSKMPPKLACASQISSSFRESVLHTSLKPLVLMETIDASLDQQQDSKVSIVKSLFSCRHWLVPRPSPSG